MASAYLQNNKRKRHASFHSASLEAGISAKSATAALPNLDSFAFTSTSSSKAGLAAETRRPGIAKDCCLEVGTSKGAKKDIPLLLPEHFKVYTQVLGSSQQENGKAQPAVEEARRGTSKESCLEADTSSRMKKPLQPPKEGSGADKENPYLVLEHSKIYSQFWGSTQQEGVSNEYEGNEEAIQDGSNLGEAIPGACDALVAVAHALVADLEDLTFGAPVSCVYNPLVYAQELHEQYIRRYGGRRIDVLLVGMNPGPFGMAQTGVPFGDSTLVKAFHRLSGKVDSPDVTHPKRPIHGLECKRSEVSGQRLWGWAQDRFGYASAFFNHFWVYNYCPLVFMEASGKNRTPDKLHPAERAKLEAACNKALKKTVTIVKPAFVIGIGKYAASKIQECNLIGVKVGDIMHPSPANPQANKDWGKKVEAQLLELGVILPF